MGQRDWDHVPRACKVKKKYVFFLRRKLFFLRMIGKHVGAAFLALCATVLEFWLCGSVLQADYLCRLRFDASEDNLSDCRASIVPSMQCQCEDWIIKNNTRTIMRVFDDGTLTMACIGFLLLLCVEVWRLAWSIAYLCIGGGDDDLCPCQKDCPLSVCELHSPVGFFGLLFANDPTRPIPSSRGRIGVFLIHLYFILLQVQLQSVQWTKWTVSLWSPVRIATLIAILCDMCEIVLTTSNSVHDVCKGRNTHLLQQLHPHTENKLAGKGLQVAPSACTRPVYFYHALSSLWQSRVESLTSVEEGKTMRPRLEN